MTITTSSVRSDLDKVQPLVQNIHVAQAKLLMFIRELYIQNPSLARLYSSCPETLDNLKAIDGSVIAALLTQPKNLVLVDLKIDHLTVKQLHLIKEGSTGDVMRLATEWLSR